MWYVANLLELVCRSKIFTDFCVYEINTNIFNKLFTFLINIVYSISQYQLRKSVLNVRLVLILLALKGFKKLLGPEDEYPNHRQKNIWRGRSVGLCKRNGNR